MLPDSDWSTEGNPVLFFKGKKKKKKELPTQPNVSKVIKTTKSSNLSSKIDVPSA